MQRINETLSQRYSALARRQNLQTTPDASIEETVKLTGSSIELPAVIENLIDNKMYRNKFRSLIKRGHLKDLLELAEFTASKFSATRGLM